jgi:phosphatidylglycerol:prolipoprotein diacylglycerol transferase
MIEWIQTLPQTLDPIAFSIGDFSLRWYAVMYLIGLLVTIFLLRWQVRKGEIVVCSWEDLFDVIIISFLGGIVGGWLGYRLFYGGDFSFEGGISGLSFHGAVVGAGLFLFYISRRKNLSFWKLADELSVVAPLAIGLGRIGNFLNGELYGRETTVWWGMDFGDGILRHPSQLYEAFFEGIVLFGIMWFFRKRLTQSGQLTSIFLIGYGSIRFFVEFFRAPDPQLGLVLFDFLSMGQVLNLGMIVMGGLFFFVRGYDRTYDRRYGM